MSGRALERVGGVGKSTLTSSSKRQCRGKGAYLGCDDMKCDGHRSGYVFAIVADGVTKVIPFLPLKAKVALLRATISGAGSGPPLRYAVS